MTRNVDRLRTVSYPIRENRSPKATPVVRILETATGASSSLHTASNSRYNLSCRFSWPTESGTIPVTASQTTMTSLHSCHASLYCAQRRCRRTRRYPPRGDHTRRDGARVFHIKPRLGKLSDTPIYQFHAYTYLFVAETWSPVHRSYFRITMFSTRDESDERTQQFQTNTQQLLIHSLGEVEQYASELNDRPKPKFILSFRLISYKLN